VKIKLEMDLTPEEFQELFIPSDKQDEFMVKCYDAYSEALRRMLVKQIDPHNFMQVRDE
jgi:hypothetical protein